MANNEYPPDGKQHCSCNRTLNGLLECSFQVVTVCYRYKLGIRLGIGVDIQDLQPF